MDSKADYRLRSTVSTSLMQLSRCRDEERYEYVSEFCSLGLMKGSGIR